MINVHGLKESVDCMVIPHWILANLLLPSVSRIELVLFHRQNPLVFKCESSAISKVLIKKEKGPDSSQSFGRGASTYEDLLRDQKSCFC